MRHVFGFVALVALGWLCVTGTAISESQVGGETHEGRVAKKAFERGEAKQGLLALQKAAQKGDLKALLRIGDILETGELVRPDRSKACKIYSLAADYYFRVDRFDPGAALVATAFRKAAKCYAGKSGSGGWERNMEAASELYYHAAVMLNDPESLFELAKLYLSGEGIPQNTALAIQHLDSAARKQFPPAQALLGSMMWEGKVMKQQKVSGLALLILGKERASSANRAWITSLYDDAMITASKETEGKARVLVDKWKSIHGDPTSQETINTVGTVAGKFDVPAPARSPTREFRGLDIDILHGVETYGSQPTGAPSGAKLPTEQKKAAEAR